MNVGYSYYTGEASTWYSSTLDSDSSYSAVGGTSYDYTYRTSYSCDNSNSEIYKWDYAYDSWNTSRAYYTGAESTWYASTLVDDGPGYTSYDYTYRNSYSYDTLDSKVYKWDYSINSWNRTGAAGLTNLAAYASQYSYYTGDDSGWLSNSLESD